MLNSLVLVIVTRIFEFLVLNSLVFVKVTRVFEFLLLNSLVLVKVTGISEFLVLNSIVLIEVTRVFEFLVLNSLVLVKVKGNISRRKPFHQIYTETGMQLLAEFQCRRGIIWIIGAQIGEKQLSSIQDAQGHSPGDEPRNFYDLLTHWVESCLDPRFSEAELFGFKNQLDVLKMKRQIKSYSCLILLP